MVSVVSISESVPIGTAVYTVIASDPEGTSVTYRLGANLGTAVFAIGPADGVLTVRQSLIQPVYNLSIIVTDSGTPARSSVLQLTVVVVGANNHDPVITTVNSPRNIPESTPVGATVLNVSATDSDRGLAGQVRYDLVAGDDTASFVLDGLSGVLTVNRQLNVDVRSRYWLTIAARDLGSPPRSSNTTVPIIVTQSFLRTPVLTASPFIGQVYENLVAPVFVTRIRTDRPSSSITYSLADSSVGSMFNIDGSTGVVTSLVAVDRETTAQYSFEVVATISGMFMQLIMSLNFSSM